MLELLWRTDWLTDWRTDATDFRGHRVCPKSTNSNVSFVKKGCCPSFLTAKKLSALLFLNPAGVPRKFMTVPCPYLSESEDTFSFTMFGENFELYCSEMLQNPFPSLFPDFIQKFSNIPDFPWLSRLSLNLIWFSLTSQFVETLNHSILKK